MKNKKTIRDIERHKSDKMPSNDRLPFLFIIFIYLFFFLSGVSALIYEVVWVRSLSLIFGGSHLAVTTVLSVFMGGLALGGYIIGRYVDRIKKPLTLYGKLEIGIALSAILFIVLLKIYPYIYVPLARGRDDSILYISSIRVIFGSLALIIPTTLMGGTLPVLTRFVSYHPERLGKQLSFLYGFNTLGAVVGAAIAGFYLLRFYSVGTSLWCAIVTNTIIGFASIAIAAMLSPTPRSFERVSVSSITKDHTPPDPSFIEAGVVPRLILFGIGVSGFCALGYEVLWTRVLIMVVGASVYGFTTMLIAFLTGIAIGSKSYALVERILSIRGIIKGHALGFGIVQILIGITALFVTIRIRYLPLDAFAIEGYFRNAGFDIFEAKQWANLFLAFLYMLLPALFMGLAFPIAGKVHSVYRGMIGRAVGEVLAYNTVGAILGASLSGYLLVYLFGIERSLQMLTTMNVGFGLLILASLHPMKSIKWGAATATMLVLAVLAFGKGYFHVWDKKYFAIFRANQPEAFNTPEKIREALENTEVLYYAEGVEAIISSIKVKGGMQAFITNGRVEASSSLWDQQVQYTLGHLPMILSKDPRKVLVVGLGSGMTLGATSVHPSVEELILVEIEPALIGIAKTFARYNHNVLESPKLRIIFNDGRNFLLTTDKKFDVITADPIHPWFRGAGYLYTDEYFRLASKHLTERGVMCQWLPIYELTSDDLRSVVRTFTNNFKYTMLWVTFYDSVMIGSNVPIIIDESEIERRLSVSPVREDMERVMMGSVEDLLCYFMMGKEGMHRFSRGGIINTDDNLYLEFSAPLSMGKGFLMSENILEIVKYREDVSPYLRSASDGNRKKAKYLSRLLEAGAHYDLAHALFLAGRYRSMEFQRVLDILEKRYPWYAPYRFLKREYLKILSMEPRPLKAVAFLFSDLAGGRYVVELTAVMSRISEEMTIVDFVDNQRRIIYSQLHIQGNRKDDEIMRISESVFDEVIEYYKREFRAKGAPPLIDPVLGRLRAIIAEVENKMP